MSFSFSTLSWLIGCCRNVVMIFVNLPCLIHFGMDSLLVIIMNYCYLIMMMMIMIMIMIILIIMIVFSTCNSEGYGVPALTNCRQKIFKKGCQFDNVNYSHNFYFYFQLQLLICWDWCLFVLFFSCFLLLQELLYFNCYHNR